MHTFSFSSSSSRSSSSKLTTSQPPQCSAPSPLTQGTQITQNVRKAMIYGAIRAMAIRRRHGAATPRRPRQPDKCWEGILVANDPHHKDVLDGPRRRCRGQIPSAVATEERRVVMYSVPQPLLCATTRTRPSRGGSHPPSTAAAGRFGHRAGHIKGRKWRGPRALRVAGRLPTRGVKYKHLVRPSP